MKIRVRGWVKGLGLAYGKISIKVKLNNIHKNSSGHLRPQNETSNCSVGVFLDVALWPKLQTACTYYDEFCFKDILGLPYGYKLFEGYALGLLHLNQTKSLHAYRRLITPRRI